MKRALITLPVLALLFAGCAATAPQTATPEMAQADEDSDEGQQRKIEALERELEIARRRLQVAKLEEAAFARQLDARMRHANTERGMAKALLARFREADAPNRIASERLNLQTAKDRAQEAADELAQIEIMYKDQDLDDLTAEFVVARGRRTAARAAARIVIQESRLKALEERELPQEGEGLELAFDKAVTGLADAEADGEIGRHGKAISVREAMNTIVRIEGELADLKKEEEKS